MRLLLYFTLLISASAEATMYMGPGISIFPPFQTPYPNSTATPVRLSVLFGKHRFMGGIDLAAGGNITTGKFIGSAAAGLFNLTYKEAVVVGMQAAGALNINKGKTVVTGLQFAGITNLNRGKTTLVGAQIAGLANISSDSYIVGLQFAPYNAAAVVTGAQVGFYNRAESLNGFQFGLVNVTEVLRGIQIGLININKASSIKIFPLIRAFF